MSGDDSLDIWKQLVAQQQQLLALQQQQKEFQEKTSTDLAAIREILAQARGGWKVFLWVGSIGVGMATVAAWVWANVIPHIHIK